MILPENSLAVKIFIGETAKYQGRPLYEAIVLKAKDLNLAGATVYRGIMGFGADSRMHSFKFLRISENLPVIVEIVDKEERINLILPFLNEAVVDGLITIEDVKVIKYHRKVGEK